ncbi:MAG TPA: hypothetical protein VK067_08315 [Pseudogracilibacillus sp.]|nr:hypothetical protein [Pseudogracilibacillus sp.]
MRKTLASISVVSAIISAILVFTPFFKTPPVPILLFAIIGIIFGLVSGKEVRGVSMIGIIISLASLIYLVYLFIQLGG